jgi:hypothetical protein
LDELFAVTLDVSLSFRAIAFTGERWAYYIHYVLHAPFQILKSCFPEWGSMSEACGEAMHKPWKAALGHTTCGGALGRGYSQAGTNGEALLVNRDQRVRSKDMFALFQIMRRHLAHTILENKEIIDHMESVSQMLGGEPAIQFLEDLPNPQPDRQNIQHNKSQSADPILAWDVIKRAGTPSLNLQKRPEVSSHQPGTLIHQEQNKRSAKKSRPGPQAGGSHNWDGSFF